MRCWRSRSDGCRKKSRTCVGRCAGTAATAANPLRRMVRGAGAVGRTAAGAGGLPTLRTVPAGSAAGATAAGLLRPVAGWRPCAGAWPNRRSVYGPGPCFCRWPAWTRPTCAWPGNRLGCMCSAMPTTPTTGWAGVVRPGAVTAVRLCTTASVPTTAVCQRRSGNRTFKSLTLNTDTVLFCQPWIADALLAEQARWGRVETASPALEFQGMQPGSALPGAKLPETGRF